MKPCSYFWCCMLAFLLIMFFSFQFRSVACSWLFQLYLCVGQANPDAPSHYTLSSCAGNRMATKLVRDMTPGELCAWLKEKSIDESCCKILTESKKCCMYFSYLLLISATCNIMFGRSLNAFPPSDAQYVLP